MKRLVITSDGSHTIFVPELDEHYHSVFGAVQESDHIFIRNGFRFIDPGQTDIFETGFGTGLNALLTLLESEKTQRKVNYTTIEKFPLSDEIISQLNYSSFVPDEYSRFFHLIHSVPWGKKVGITRNFFLEKIRGDLLTYRVSGKYNLIYFDAFGPQKQPEMWTNDVFAGISQMTVKGGVLMTYSSMGEVKRNLRSCGFRVFLLPGPPGKRQIIRAIKM